MFNAYEIAIKVSMVNAVSPALKLMQGQFKALSVEAEAFQNKLNKIKSLAIVGGSMVAAGSIGLFGMGKLMRPAMEYEHQLNILRMAGLSQLEIANATAMAWKTTKSVITTTATDNLKTFMDLRNVIGDANTSMQLTPMMARMQAVLMSSKEGSSIANNPNFVQNFAFSVVKSMDILGKAIDPKEFAYNAQQFSKVITAFQGRISPQAFQQTITYARQARFGFDDAFLYRFLPTLMLEYGQGNNGGNGGSHGVGPMLAAFYRVTNQGYINRKSLPLLEQLGLVNPNTALLTTTSGTTVGQFTRSDLAARNPFLWVQEVLMPSIYKQFGKNISKIQISDIINTVFKGNQGAQTLANEYALKPQNFIRDASIVSKAMLSDVGYQYAILNDPMLDMFALSQQWNNFLISAFLPVVSDLLIPTLLELTDWFGKLKDVLLRYPNMTKTITLSFIGLSAALLFGGSVLLLTAAFRGLWTVLKIGYYAIFPMLLTFGEILVSGFVFLIPYADYIVGLAIAGVAIYKIYKLLQDPSFIHALDAFNNFMQTLMNNLAKFFANMSLKAIFGNIPGLTVDNISKAVHFIKKVKPIEEWGNHNNINNKSNLTSPIVNKNNNNQPITLIMKVNHEVLGKVAVNHMAKNINKTPNNTSIFDTAMSYVPTFLQATQLF